MPQGSKKNIMGPLDSYGQADPNLNFSNVRSERIGSRDNFLTGDSFDKYFEPLLSQNQQRYQNQSFTNWFGYNAAKLGSKTLTGLGGIVGGGTSLAASPFVVAAGGNFWDAFEKNPVNQFLEATNTVIDEFTPTFVEDNFHGDTFLGQLRSPGQLLSANVDSLAFLMSSIYGGAALGKLNVGSKVMSKIGAARGLEEVISGAKAANLVGKAQKIDNLLSHTVLTTSEAAQEGADAKKTIKAKLEGERSEGRNTYTDEQIDQMSDEKSRNVFWMNMGTLALTNIPFTKLYSNIFSKAKPRDIDLGIKLGANGFEAEKLTGVSKLLNGKEFLPTLTRNMLTAVTFEGLEESMQFSIQKINENSKRSLTVGESMQEYLTLKNAYDTTVGIFTDKERGKAAGLGALMGGAGVGVQSFLSRGDYKNYLENQSTAIDKLNKQFDGVTSANPYKKAADTTVKVTREQNPDGSFSYATVKNGNVEKITTADFKALQENFKLPDEGGEYTIKGSYELDADGNPVIDPALLSTAIASANVHAELDDMMDNENMFGNDNAKKTLIRQEKLQELAKTALDASSMDLLIERFETARDDDKGLEKYGASREQLNEDIQSLKRLQNIYDNVNKDLLAASTSKDGQRLNHIRKTRMYQLGARLDTIKRLESESNAELTKLKLEAMATLDLDSKDNIEKGIEVATKIKQSQTNLELLFRQHDGAVQLNNFDKIAKLKDKIAKEQEKLDELNNNFKSFDTYSKSLRKSELENIVNESLKQSQLQVAAKELTDVYDQYLTTKDLNKIKDIEDTAFDTYSETAPKSITIDDNTTLGFLKAYEGRRRRKINSLDQRELAQREFNKHAVESFVAQNVVEDTNPYSQARSLVSLVKELLNSGSKIYPQTLARIQSLTNKLIESIDPNEETEDGDLVIDEVMDILKDYGSELLLDKLTTEDVTGLKSDDEINDTLFQELTSGARTVINDFEQSPEEYEDLASVDAEIKKLNNLIRLYKEDARDVSVLEELLETIKTVIKPTTEANLINKELKNQRQAKLYGESFLGVLQDETISQMLKDHPDVDHDALVALYAEDPYLGYLTLVQALQKLDKSKVNEVIAKHQAELNEQSKDLLDTSNKSEPNLITKNPVKFLLYLINLNYGNNADVRREETEAISKFKQDYDIVALLRNVEGDPQMEGVVKAFFRAYSLLDAAYAVNSTHSSTDIVAKIKEVVADNDKEGGMPAPSIAQERVITQLVHFLSSPMENATPHNNIAALKSPPGAGKTLIIIPTLLKVLGLKPENLLAASPKELAAENLAKGTGVTKGHSLAQLVEMLDKDEVDPRVQVVVLDEATVALPNELYDLATAFTRFQLRNPDRKLKMIYLYDPNQGTARADGLSIFDHRPYSVPSEARAEAVNKGQDTIYGEFHYSHNIYDIIPLPVSYRSDVPQVLSIQNRFLSKSDVPTNIEAASSSDPKASMANIQGTFVEKSGVSMTTLIEKSKKENPNRTRAIIVLREDQKAKYVPTNVLTLTAEEAAGLTFDEVYVDTPSNNVSTLDEIRAYNQRVYTALSRAKHFAYLANFDGLNVVDTTIPDKVKVNAAFKSSRHKASVEEKEEYLKTINKIVKSEEKETPKEKEAPKPDEPATEPKEPKEEEPIILDEFDDEPSSDAVPIEVPTIAPKAATSQGGVFTNNAVLKEIVSLAKGSPQDVTIVREENNGKVRYRVLKPFGTTNKFFDVAILTEEAYDNILTQLGIDPATVQTVSDGVKSKVQSGVVEYPRDVAATIRTSAKVQIDPESSPIRYAYGNDSLDFRNPEDLNILVKRLLTTLEYGGMAIENHEEILSNLDKYVTLRMYTSQAQKAKDFPDKSVANTIPMGKPLLVVSGMKPQNGAGTVTQWIELETPKLDATSSEFERYSGPSLLKVVGLLNKFDTTLKGLDLPPQFAIYKQLAPGVPLVNPANGATYYPFHNFIVTLSNAFSGNDAIITVGDPTTNAAFNKLNPQIALPPIGREYVKELLEIAHEIDALVHGDISARTGEKGVLPRNYNGKAQVAFDRIATANMIVELPNGTTKILRSTRTKGGDAYVGGLTLLGPVGFAIDEKKAKGTRSSVGMSYNPLFPEKVREQLKQKFQRNPNNKWASAPGLKEILEGDEGLSAQYFTLEDFNSLISPQGFANANSGFGLRAPIYAPLFKEGAIPVTDVKLHGVVETKFSHVRPTTLGLVHNGKSTLKLEPLPQKAESSAVADAKADIRQAVIEGTKPPVLDDKTKEEFEKDSGVTVEEYTENYADSTIAEFIKRPNFIKTMYKVFSNTYDSLSKELFAIVDASKSAVGGSLENAPRDFVASYVIAKLIGATNSTFSPARKSMQEVQGKVLDTVKYYYSSTKTDAKTNAGFADKMSKLGVSIEHIIEEADALRAAVADLSSKHLKQTITLPQVKTMADLLPFVRAAVLFSSEMRKTAPAAVAIEIPTSSATPRSVVTPLERFKALTAEGKTVDEIVEALIKEYPEHAITTVARKKVAADPDIEPQDLYSDIEALAAKFYQSSETIEELDAVSEQEAAQVFKSIFNPLSIKYISNIFKSGKGENFRIIKANEMIHRFGKQAWGAYEAGVTYVVGQAGKVGRKVVLHEAFHYVVDAYLTKSEKQRLFNLAEKRYGKLSQLELEEKLANDFMNYTAKVKTFSGRIVAFFRKLARFFNFTFHNFRSIEDFFESTLDGGFRQKEADGDTRFLEIERLFGTFRNYEIAKNLVLDKFEGIQEDARQGKYILSFDEVIGEVFKELLEEKQEGLLPDEVVTAISPLLYTTQGLKQFTAYFFGNTPVIKAIQDRFAEARREYYNDIIEIDRQLEDPSLLIESTEGMTEEEVSALAEEAVEQLLDRKKALEELLKADISAETLDSDRVDPESKITGVVKQRLLGVKYRNKGQVVRADFGKVYNVLLNLLSSSDNSSMDALMASIKQRASSILTNKQRLAAVPTNVRAAAALFLENEVLAFEEMKATRPKHITFLKDVNSPFEYVLISKSGKDIRSMTYTAAKNDPDIFVSMFNPTAPYSTFNGWLDIVAAGSKVGKDDLGSAFRYYEQSNFIKSLVGAVSSLRRNLPSVGINENKEGRHKSRYIFNKESGAKAVLENDVIGSYIKMSEKALKAGNKNVFPAELITRLANASLVGDNFQLAKDILTAFNIKGLKRDHVNEAEVNNFIDKAKVVLPILNTITENAHDVISDESSFIEAVIELRATPGDLIQGSSYIRGDGKKAFLWVDSSWQTSLFTSIANSIKGFAGMKNQYFSIERGGKLHTKSEFLKNNIFITGKSFIKGFVDHDSVKWKGKDMFAKDLHHEGPTEALTRTFEHGFLSRFAYSDSYIQFLPIPSNRRTINGAQVKALSIADAKAALKNIITQQKNRPNPKDSVRLSNNDAYLKNWNKFNLPGIAGVDVDSLTEDQALAKVMEHLNGESGVKELVKVITDNLSKHYKSEGLVTAPSWRIDMEALARVYHKVTGKGFKSYVDFRKDLSTVNEAIQKESEEIPKVLANYEGTLQERAEAFVEDRNKYMQEVLTAVATNYFLNHIVNSYSLSQMIYGDETFYKNKEDLTKRIQVFTATGDIPIVDDVDGFPPVSRVGVMADIHSAVQELEALRDDSSRETVNEADGQGFMLPESHERLAKARGKFTEDDIVLKTVYAGVDEEGVPTLLKYSVIVLTDELIGYENGKPKNVALHNLREAMRNPPDGKGPLDQAVFESAVKIGAPAKKNLSDVSSGEVTFLPQSIVSIDNRHFRFQLNPSAEVEKTVANPSQLTSMIDTNGMNTHEAWELHRWNANLISIGMRMASRKLGISRKGRLTKSSEKVMRTRAIQSNQGMVGKESLVTMLAAKRDGVHSVSLDLPTIGDQLVSSLASMISSSTVGFRFKGSKLVLQSEFGTYINEAKKLKYKDENGFTEVLLPEAYRDFMSEGDVIANDLMMGFRVPSTNYHSAIAMKVVGFYKVPSGSAGNIIITPASMGFFSGHDYDVDSLFIIKKASLGKEVNLKTLLQGIMNAPDKVFKATDTIGATKDIDYVGEDTLSDYLATAIAKIDRMIEDSRRTDLSKAKELEERMKEVWSVFELATKNQIVHIFSNNLRDIKNRRDLLTPISFARVSRTRQDLINDLQKELEGDLAKEVQATQLGLPLDAKELLTAISALDEDVIKANPILSFIANKYDLVDDSVIELFAKLEAELQGKSGENLTSSQATALVNPSGTTHDPVTQLKIHSNTYAGVALTGISANFGKVMAYLFSAGRVTAVNKGAEVVSFLDSTGTFDKKLLKEFLNEQGAGSLNELFYRGEWKAVSREYPKLKNQHAFKLGRHTFGELSRFERNLDGSFVKAFKYGDTLVNIFETIDTIINLAIDNVKEQKLFVLGITNSNSNAFMSAIALGIPLNYVAKIFRSPVIAKASLGTDLGIESKVKNSLKELAAMSNEEITSLVTSYGGQSAADRLDLTGAQTEDARINLIKKSLSFLSIETDYLDSSYKGQTNLVGDYVILREVNKLVSLGDEVYDNALIFSLLRGMPSTKDQLDEVVEAGLRYQSIASEESSTENGVEIESQKDIVRAKVMEEKREAIRQTELYEKSNDANREAMLDLQPFSNIIEAEVERRYAQGLITRMISGKVGKNFRSKVNSVFESLTVFSIPHVYSAWLVAKRLQFLIENTFAIHSMELKDYADTIMDDLGVLKGKRTVRKLVATEFFKFVTSDMKLSLPQGEIDLKINPNTAVGVYNEGRTYNLHGGDAWAHKFASEFETFKNKYELATSEDNEFLKSVEVVTDYRGAKSLKITADKTSNPETISKIKEGYKQLLDSEEVETLDEKLNPSAVALNLFKYAAISQGLFYSRTGFSMIFPISFSEAYSQKLSEHLGRVFEKDEFGNTDAIKTRHNLNNLKSSFTYQLLRNNPQILPYRRGAKKTGSYTSKTGEYRRVFSGVEEGIYYDQSFDSVGTPPKYISSFDKDVFALIATVNGKDYYRKIISKHNISLHEFPASYAEGKTLNIDVLTSPTLDGYLINTNIVDGDVIRFPYNYNPFEKGDTVYMHEMSNPNPVRMTKASVVSIEKTSDGYNIRIKRDAPVQLLSSMSPLEKAALSRIFIPSVKQETSKSIGDNSGDIKLNLANPIEAEKSINSLTAGSYSVSKALFNDLYLKDPATAVSLATKLKAKTSVNFDVLSFTEEALSLDDIVTDRLNFDTFTPTDKGYEIKRSDNKLGFDKLIKGAFYEVGVDEGGYSVYMYVEDINTKKAQVLLVTADIISKMPEAVVSSEEFFKILNRELKSC